MKIYNHYCSDTKSKTLQSGIVNCANEVEKTIINSKTSYKTETNTHRWKRRCLVIAKSRSENLFSYSVRINPQTCNEKEKPSECEATMAYETLGDDGLNWNWSWETASVMKSHTYAYIIQYKRKLARISTQRGVAVTYGSVWRAGRWWYWWVYRKMRICSIRLEMETLEVVLLYSCFGEKNII